MTESQAIAFAETQQWKLLSRRQCAELQIEQNRSCMPLSVFQDALEKTLGRGVYTHELAFNRDGIREELFNGAPAPSMGDIVALLPKSGGSAIVASV